MQGFADFNNIFHWIVLIAVILLLFISASQPVWLIPRTCGATFEVI